MTHTITINNREVDRLTIERKRRFDALTFALEIHDRIAIDSLMKDLRAIDAVIRNTTKGIEL
jgi:hypothetical protein